MYLYGADAVAVLATCSDAASPGFISRTVGFLPRVPRQLALPHLHIWSISSSLNNENL